MERTLPILSSGKVDSSSIPENKWLVPLTEADKRYIEIAQKVGESKLHSMQSSLEDPAVIYDKYVPSDFNWAEHSDVQDFRPDVEPFFTAMAPMDQGNCGACYAYAAISSLSDRFGVLTGFNPKLQPSYLLSCAEAKQCGNVGEDGSCKGSTMLAVLTEITEGHNGGGVEKNCWNVQWDSESADFYPFAKYKNKCVTGKDFTLYQAVPQAFNPQWNILKIQLDIINNGPVPVGVYWYPDCDLGHAKWPASKGKLWSETGGIYCRTLISKQEGGVWMTSKGDVYPYKGVEYTATPSGGHAMSITGWGVKTVKNFLPKAFPKKDTLDIRYWVVRNSYGTDWGFGGYFKIAMPGFSTGLNMLSGLYNIPGMPVSESQGIWSIMPSENSIVIDPKYLQNRIKYSDTRPMSDTRSEREESPRNNSRVDTTYRYTPRLQMSSGRNILQAGGNDGKKSKYAVGIVLICIIVIILAIVALLYIKCK